MTKTITISTVINYLDDKDKTTKQLQEYIDSIHKEIDNRQKNNDITIVSIAMTINTNNKD